ncbi:MAG: caspase family protein [Chitinophagaceae bacterium]
MKKAKLPILFIFLILTTRAFSQVEMTVNVRQTGVSFLSPDAKGQQLLTFDNNSFYRWDIRTGRCLQQKKIERSVKTIKLSTHKKYFITAEESGSRIFMAVYDTRNFERLALVSTDSITRNMDRDYYSLRQIQNLCIDEQSGWLAAVVSHAIIFFNITTGTAGFTDISGATTLRSIAFFNGNWLVGGEHYAKQLPAIWRVDTTKPYRVGLHLTLRKEEEPSEMISIPGGKQLLLITGNRRTALLAADGTGLTPITTPANFAYWPNGGNNYQYSWYGADQYLCINTDPYVYSYHPGDSLITQIAMEEKYTNRFFIPFGDKPKLYIAKNLNNTTSLCITDFNVWQKRDTDYYTASIVDYGSSELVSFYNIQKTNNGQYLLSSINKSCIVDLNNLKSLSLRIDNSLGYTSTRHLLYFPRTRNFGEPFYTHNNANTEVSLLIKEHNPAKNSDTLSTMVSIKEDQDIRPVHIYAGITGDSLYLVDAVANRAFIFDRINRRISSKLTLPEKMAQYWPLYEERFTPLQSGNFLYVADKMIHYNIHTQTARIIDQASLGKIKFFAFDSSRNIQFYLTQQDEYPYHHQLRSYNTVSGDTSVVLDAGDTYSLLISSPFNFKGMPCWIAGLRNGEIQVRSRDMKQVLYSFFVEKYTDIRDITVDEEKQQMLILLSDNSLRLLDASTFQPVARLYFSQSGRDYLTIAIDNDNNYFMPSRQTGAVNWVYNGKAYDFSAFDKYYNKPAVLLKELKTKDTVYTQLLQKAFNTRQKRLARNITIDKLKDLPVAEIISKELPFSTDSIKLKIPLHIRAGKRPVIRYQLSINNVPSLHTDAGTFKRPLKAGKDTIFNYMITLSPGRSNRIVLQVFDDSNNVSLPAETNVYRRKANTRYTAKTWYLGFGCSSYRDSNFNLKYAKKDINDIATAYKKKLYSSDLGGVMPVTDSLVNLKNIVAGFAWLAENAATDDIVIISFSGHGITSKDGRFYFMLYDTDFRNPEKTSLSFDAVFEMLKVLPCRNKLVLVDACESGDFDEEGSVLTVKPAVTAVIDSRGLKPQYKSISGPNEYLELMKEYFADISSESGATIIGASSGTDLAFENDEWRNGIFSLSFLKGIFNLEADEDKDDKISISELRNYMTSWVEKLTDGKQRPSVRNMDMRNDWIIIKKSNIDE